MSEPETLAKSIEEVVPGVYRWFISDERIDGSESDAYAVVDGGRVVLIDPLPLEPGAEAALTALGPIEEICLTGSCHQRSAWRFKTRFGARVHAPRGSERLEQEPYATYDNGDELPGGLTAVHAPGPTESHFALYRSKGHVLFVPDLLIEKGRGLVFIEDAYQDDPVLSRLSVKKLLDLPFRVICFSHGAPIVEGAKEALRDALRKDEAS